MGICDWQIHDRSDLVGLSLLDAEILNTNYGLKITQIGLPLVVIYVAADIGSIGGGWLSSMLIKRNWSVNKARKTAMLVCALAVVPVMLARARLTSLGCRWVCWFGGRSAPGLERETFFTMASDMFPRRAVGSVVGIGGMAGAIGGMLIASTVGLILQYTGSYLPIFVIAGSTYLVALGIIHLLRRVLNRLTSKLQSRKNPDGLAQHTTNENSRWDLVSLGEVMLGSILAWPRGDDAKLSGLGRRRRIQRSARIEALLWTDTAIVTVLADNPVGSAGAGFDLSGWR